MARARAREVPRGISDPPTLKKAIRLVDKLADVIGIQRDDTCHTIAVWITRRSDGTTEVIFPYVREGRG